MKKMRKIMALVLALVMCISMSMAVFAEGDAGNNPTKYSITVDTTDDTSTHTYKIYQIFTGTPDAKGELTDVQYGSSYPGGLTGAVPSATLEAITDARVWAAANKNSLGAEVATLDGDTISYDAVPGWYLILDTSYVASDTDKDAYSAFMMKVVDKETQFKPKKSVPSVDKKVKDENEDAEEGATDGWGETADHEIGETFQFQLTATIPVDVNLKAYKSYKVQFNDTMSEGVTFEKINSVKVNDTVINEEAYTSTASAGQAGGSWTLTIADIKQISGVDLGNAAVTIEVEYDAHLNSKAAVNTESGVTTNKNTVSLTYSNNPDATGIGETDTTPQDDVWVFTYASNNTKVDKNNEPVAGAGFTLKDSAGNAIELYQVGTTYYKYDKDKKDYPTGGKVVTEMITTAETGKFDIKGLDVGTYTLEETKIPDGYVKCDDITVTIGATHAETSGEGHVELNSTNQNNTVVNLTGTTLPETGGIGTTIFYVLGAILVLGAGIVLVTRRRMSVEK